LDLARKNGIKSVAFPNISTGVYRFPKTDAANIAIREVSAYLKNIKESIKVIFAVFDEENFTIYSEKLSL